MHDVLRERVWRRLEGLPQEQLYQVLDYIEFLEAKYAREKAREPDVLQKFAERVEDSLRMRSVAPAVISGTVGLLGSARRVMRTVSDAGRDILGTPAASGTRPPATGTRPPISGGRTRLGSQPPTPAMRGPETVIRRRPVAETRGPETVIRRRRVGEARAAETVTRQRPATDTEPPAPPDGQEPARIRPQAGEQATGSADNAEPGSANQENHGTP